MVRKPGRPLQAPANNDTECASLARLLQAKYRGVFGLEGVFDQLFRPYHPLTFKTQRGRRGNPGLLSLRLAGPPVESVNNVAQEVFQKMMRLFLRLRAL